MNTTQLETFINVYESHSFSKSAQAMYITHTAIIQQMNLLEESLGVTLFNRTHHGVEPTAAGDYLYNKAKLLLEEEKQIKAEIKQFDSANKLHYISDFEKSYLGALFDGYVSENHLEKVFEHHATFDTQQNPNIPFDIFESMEYNVPELQYSNFLKVRDVPICVAVLPIHPLAGKAKVTINDLKPYPVITIKRGLISSVNKLNSDLKRADVCIKEITVYNANTIHQYLSENAVIQIPNCWRHIFTDLVFIPGDWNYDIPYGYYYHDDAPEEVLKYIDYVSAHL